MFLYIISSKVSEFKKQENFKKTFKIVLTRLNFGCNIKVQILGEKRKMTTLFLTLHHHS